MNSEQFVWWLKGYLDNTKNLLTKEEIEVIRSKVATLTPAATITTSWDSGLGIGSTFYKDNGLGVGSVKNDVILNRNTKLGL